MAEPQSGPGARVLVVSDDEDVAEPLRDLLKRAGYRAGLVSGREAPEVLPGAPPDVLILDRDLAPSQYQAILARLEAFPGRASFPLLILGGGPAPPLPRGWHEDASLSVGRPPEPGEVLASVAALRRLAFYRLYRDLIHDLSQPVTTLHALSRSIARLEPPDDASRQAIERLVAEADRLMTLLEEFQRKRAGGA
jgi:DNA-binding response OmpR family regulator